jgi:hypothetical protein
MSRGAPCSRDWVDWARHLREWDLVTANPSLERTPRMIEHHYCACGYAAPTAGELVDHLHEVFSLGDDTAPDGTQHAEVARHQPATDPLRCLCGYPPIEHQAASLDDLDRHILAAYTPANATAADGTKHVAASADP